MKDSIDSHSGAGASTELRRLRAWQDGDARAGGDLMRYYRATLTRCFGRRRCEGRVDDLVQETILAGIRARDHIVEPYAYRRYLFVAARRILAREIDRRKREGPGPRDLDPTDMAESAGAALASAQLAEVYEAMRHIPREYVDALAHYYLHGRRGAELARALGVPEGTARSRIRRGLARIRHELGHREPQAEH
jgi:RNA polymerase sigma-70 factor (ECF subfamily)